jgi:hypothetical protein
MKLLPGIEHEHSVYSMDSREVLLRFGARFGDSYDLTFIWFFQRVLRIILTVL